MTPRADTKAPAHTPGPWVAQEGTTTGMEVVAPGATKAERTVARCGGAKRRKANAHLIAAAPEMLEALRRAQQFIANGVALGFIRMPDAGTPDPAHETPGIIAAAIAKATSNTEVAE